MEKAEEQEKQEEDDRAIIKRWKRMVDSWSQGSVRHAKEDLYLQSQREGIAGARGVRKEEWGY